MVDGKVRQERSGNKASTALTASLFIQHLPYCIPISLSSAEVPFFPVNSFSFSCFSEIFLYNRWRLRLWAQEKFPHIIESISPHGKDKFGPVKIHLRDHPSVHPYVSRSHSLLYLPEFLKVCKVRLCCLKLGKNDQIALSR